MLEFLLMANVIYVEGSEDGGKLSQLLWMRARSACALVKCKKLF